MPRQKATRPDDKRLKGNRPRTTPIKPKTRLQQLIDGDLTVEDLDDDELRLGRTKNAAGNFGGRPPKMLPATLVQAMQVEFRKRIQERLDETAETAINALLDVAANKKQAGVARVNAANSLLERVIGKVPDKVVQDIVVHKFEEDLGDIFVEVPDEVARKRAEKEAS